MSDAPENTPADSAFGMTIAASNRAALIGVFLRHIGAAGSFFVAVLGFVRGHDLKGLFDYLQDDSVVPAIGAMAALAFLVWGWVRVIIAKRRLLLAAALPPEKVIVK